MIKENQKLFNRLNVFSDAAISILAVMASYFLVFMLMDLEHNYPLDDYVKLALVFIPVQLITYGCLGLYDSYRTSNFGKEFSRLVQAFFIDGLIIITMLYIVKIINFSRLALVIFLVLDLLLISLKRYLLRRSLKRFRQSGYNKKHIVIIGGGDIAKDYLETIRREKQMGFECAGYISDKKNLDAKHLGGYDDVFDILDRYSYSEAICALDSDDMEHLGSAVEACELTGTKISVIPVIYKYMSATPAIDLVGGIPMMNIRRIPLDNIGNAVMKRAMDIVGSFVMILLTLPIMLVSAVVIKLTMGGKVIFKQQRVGLNKKIFTMYKLKSMKDNDTSETAWSTDNDPRKTKFGSFIRKFSIDELPQLFNVLKGDMSLVGPRPEIPFHVDNFKSSIPMYMLKHQVKPGMTGLAQVNGYRGDTSIKRRVEYDIEYIENWNIFLDVAILFKTLFSFVNKEKIKKSNKKYKSENFSMTNEKQKTDILSLAIFFPAVVALAIIPIIIRVTMVATDMMETYRYFKATPGDDGLYYMTDVYSQGKAFMVVLLAMIMLGMAFVCCGFLFRRAEKRTLVYTGASVVYVLMALASALGSDYQSIAFYGVHDRAEGFFTMACYFVMFLFTLYAFRKTQNFKYIVGALMICAGVNFIIGMFQFTGNNLFSYEWFEALTVDKNFSDYLVLDKESVSYGSMYGALYHYNYVGSFTGMVIPLFSVLAIYGKKIWHKIVYAAFAGMSLFMLLASTARSGIVAVAAAFVVGVIVFARVLIRRWKVTAAVTAAALVAVVGVNIVLDNALFERIPSLVGDVVDFIAPSEKTDLFSKLPVRDIKHNNDGSVSFTTQTDVLNIAFNADTKKYDITDSSGAALKLVPSKEDNVIIDDDDFKGINLEFVSTGESEEYDDAFFMSFNDELDKTLTFVLFNKKQLHMVDMYVGDRVTPVNAEAIGFEGKELLGSSRGYIWSRTIPLLKNCLFTGYGPDTFVYVFPQNDYLAKYYSYHEGFYITVDKPHNLYLQIFVNNGLIALIAFLTICVFYLVDCFRLYALRKYYRTEQIYGISVMLAIIGYLAAGIFNDSVVSVAPVFWILLGTGAALNTINRRLDKNQSIDVDEIVEEKKRKTAKELEHEKAVSEQAANLAASIRGSKETVIKINKDGAKNDVEALLNRVKDVTERHGGTSLSGPDVDLKDDEHEH
ncbi:MAG: undecaprenyl-phosphate glucose phosphotransferase [Oscillospiraceae bacterium]|nr:undecaprenyl-phosphate glucose phosphotransferase [Oscillospiraceae bacterium]